MTVGRGDVVLLQAPFTSRIGAKARPMLVVQNDRNNARMANTILVFIESNREHLICARKFPWIWHEVGPLPMVVGVRSVAVYVEFASVNGTILRGNIRTADHGSHEKHGDLGHLEHPPS